MVAIVIVVRRRLWVMNSCVMGMIKEKKGSIDLSVEVKSLLSLDKNDDFAILFIAF